MGCVFIRLLDLTPQRLRPPEHIQPDITGEGADADRAAARGFPNLAVANKSARRQW
jgi:hypothetical protein